MSLSLPNFLLILIIGMLVLPGLMEANTATYSPISDGCYSRIDFEIFPTDGFLFTYGAKSIPMAFIFNISAIQQGCLTDAELYLVPAVG